MCLKLPLRLNYGLRFAAVDMLRRNGFSVLGRLRIPNKGISRHLVLYTFPTLVNWTVVLIRLP